MAQGIDEALQAAWREAFAGIGEPAPAIASLEAVSGGSINRSFRARTSRGDFFCKWNPQAPPDMFRKEKDGLEALRAAGTSLKIPRVVALGPEGGTVPPLLVLEYLESSPGPADRAWARLGAGLAELHRHRADSFGFPQDNYLGLTPQENAWSESWPEFYARRRLGALLDRLENRADLTPKMIQDFRKLQDRLPALLSHHPAPSLVHGDLWSGNYLASTEGPALLDPAAHYADREAEWGMMLLFGGFPAEVLDSYQEAWSFLPGWEERVPLYQLYHVLNHFLLFGGGYGESARRIAKRYL